jgi:hypothetical protein
MGPVEIRRIERWLATARLTLAISSLFAIWMYPTQISSALGLGGTTTWVGKFSAGVSIQNFTHVILAVGLPIGSHGIFCFPGGLGVHGVRPMRVHQTEDREMPRPCGFIPNSAEKSGIAPSLDHRICARVRFA